MFIPIWLLVLGTVLVVGLAAWSFLLARDRNPLPFPDRGSRIFSAVSAEAKDAVVSLLAKHGVRERFRFNTDGVLRSIMWDGTIINHASARCPSQARVCFRQHRPRLEGPGGQRP